MDLDARKLAQSVFGRGNPRLKINQLKRSTDRNEQTGTQLLAEGVVSAFRNPAAHETRLNWHISE
ncbi:TIGR02391 family protein [Corynebacterium aurimucosum]|nr:TIGR02391 family protein [Corynebacterium aurimucosum]